MRHYPITSFNPASMALAPPIIRWGQARPATCFGARPGARRGVDAGVALQRPRWVRGETELRPFPKH